jgi:predicted DNA-binding transcriptional regulator AlpA
MSDDDIQALAAAVADRVAQRLHADADRLLDRAALAERLSVAERTISGMVSRGELPGPLLHTGGIARWRWEDVLKWLASQTGKVRRGRGRWDRDAVTRKTKRTMRTNR